MIEQIADKILTDIIAGISWEDHYTGIVKRAVRNYPTPAGIVEKSFPIAWNTNPTACNESQFMEYVPNDKKKSIIYFEDLGTGTIEEQRRFIKVEHQIRLICWANLKRINSSLTDYQQLLIDIISALPKRVNNFDNFNRIVVRLEGIVREDIFSDYSYSEAERQFFIYPYDFFGINIKVNYAVNTSCTNRIELNPSTCF